MKLLLAVCLVLALPVPAHATDVTQFSWDRTGAENLPCAGSVDWLLSPGDGIDNATVGINDADGIPDGHAWTMQKDWNTGDFYIQTTEPVATTDEVLVAYVGTASPPELTLSDCTPSEVVPPVVPPTEQPVPTPAPTIINWSIGFQVTTIRRTNVLAVYRLVCSDGTVSVPVKHRVRGMTPLVRNLAPTIQDATSCHLHVIAWDIPPHVRPHSWPAPVVTTWVNPT